MAEPARANMIAVRRFKHGMQREANPISCQSRATERALSSGPKNEPRRELLQQGQPGQPPPYNRAGGPQEGRRSSSPAITLQRQNHSCPAAPTQVQDRPCLRAAPGAPAPRTIRPARPRHSASEHGMPRERRVSASVAASSVRPIRSRPERPSAISCTRRMASSTCSSIWRAPARNSAPADVSPVSRCRSRASRLIPTRSSSPAICLVSAGCVISSRWAARRRFSSSAATTK
jgi:hypothetical protein